MGGLEFYISWISQIVNVSGEWSVSEWIVTNYILYNCCFSFAVCAMTNDSVVSVVVVAV